MDTDRVLTVQMVADKLKCSPPTVIELLRSERLKGFRLGPTGSGHWRIRESALKEMEEEATGSVDERNE